jgi:hypothetical protein
MIRIRPFNIKDAQEMALRPIYHETSKEQFIKESVFGKSFSIYESQSGLVLACATLIRMRKHSAVLNMILDTHFVKYTKEFIYVLRESSVYYMKELGLTRVHATIRADFHNAEKWIKIVGFEKEGVMRNYGPDGEDHILFAKVVI